MRSTKDKILYILKTDASGFGKAITIYNLLLEEDPLIFVKNPRALIDLKVMAHTDSKGFHYNTNWEYMKRRDNEKIISQYPWYRSVKTEFSKVMTGYEINESGFPLLQVIENRETGARRILVMSLIFDEIDPKTITGNNFLGYIRQLTTTLKHVKDLYSIFADIPRYLTEYSIAKVSYTFPSRNTELVQDILTGKDIVI